MRSVADDALIPGTRADRPGTDGVLPDTDDGLQSSRLMRRWEILSSRPGATVLLLRAFLGVTFTFAGLQKLANPNFFRSNKTGSFDQQLVGAIATSPLHHLLAVATHAPVAFAIVISFAELAVGIGTLLGFFSRIAAVGGIALSCMFFLTVSFNDNPYYYGADIVFLFAWSPLLIGGSGEFGLDALLEQRRLGAQRQLDVTNVGTACMQRELLEVMNRRAFVRRASLAGIVGALVVVLGSSVDAIGRVLARSSNSPSAAAIGVESSSPRASNSTGQAAKTAGSTPKGTKIGPASSVPVGTAASFTDPAQGIPAYVVHTDAKTFVAFSAICTHAGCQVQFVENDLTFACPCHGSVFNAFTGAVEHGPAPLPLPHIAVALDANGELYVDGYKV